MNIYTLSLHDALPIWHRPCGTFLHGACQLLSSRRADRGRNRTGDHAARHTASARTGQTARGASARGLPSVGFDRSEEHTSELQSRENLVCRLLLEKKK